MSVLNHKNQYIASGVIKSIDKLYVKDYKNKYGEQVEWRERKFIIRNKFSKRKVWHINDIEFVGQRDAVDALEELMPGLEVIVNFSIREHRWVKDGEEKRWQTLEAWNIMSLKDVPVKDEWWLPRDKQPVKKGTEYEAPPTLTVQDRKRRTPNTKSYNYKTFNPGSDYSDKKEEEDDDLPF